MLKLYKNLLKDKQVNHILVIRFSALGDVVLLSCLFRETKKIFPAAKIDFLTYNINRDLYKNCPYIEKEITWPKIRSFPQLKTELSKLELKKYSLILDAHASNLSRLICLLTWGTTSFRIKKQNLKKLLFIKLRVNLFKKIKSTRQKYLNLLASFCNSQKLDDNTEIWLDEETKKKVAQKSGLDLKKKYIALAPGASSVLKTWPIEQWIKFCQKLGSQDYLIIGAYSDTICFELAKRLDSKAINLAGTLSPIESCHALSLCKFSVANDSAVLHMSEAVKVPTIGIFGPTVKEFGFGPHFKTSLLAETNLYCRPCSKHGRGECRNKNYLECLKAINPLELADMAKRLYL